MFIVIALLHIVIIFLLTLPFVLTLFATSVGRKKIVPLPDNDHSLIAPHFACVITAYRHADIALPLIHSLLQQDYPHFTIYLVADQCHDTDIFNDLRNNHPERVKILLPTTPLQSKVKSMQYAVSNFTSSPTHVVVFDPDNLANPDFLTIMTRFIQAGYKAIQGKRVAKNLDTPYACADALGEIYKNYIERYVPFTLQSSATIAGSGMTVNISLFKEFLTCKEITKRQAAGQVVAAEDKILHNFLVQQNEIIAFANDALVYDEKVATGEQVTRQRTRWLFAYFENVRNALGHLGSGIAQWNWNKMLFGSLSLIPPLFILLAIALLIGCIDGIIIWQNNTSIFDVIEGNAAWDKLFWYQLTIAIWAAIGIFAANILLTLYLDKAPKAIWQAVGQLPFFMARQMMSLFQIKKAKSDFLTTQHNKVMTLEEVHKNGK